MTTNASPLLRVVSLAKRYEQRPILKGVSFTLEAGEALLLRGDNGSGKSTLLSIIAGARRADSGSVSIANIDAHRDPRAKLHVGFVAHAPMLHPGLTPRENLTWFARAWGLAGPANAARQSLARFGLDKVADQETRTLSRGQSQRAALARALLPDPALLLLDEPLTGLDDRGRAELGRELLRLRDEGRALLMTSHEDHPALAAATRHAELRDGLFVENTSAAWKATVESGRRP